MKRRYLYLLLFALPALLAAVIISITLFGATAGALWLFVFGDNTWPASVNNLLTAMFFLVGIALWLALLSAAYRVGRRQEQHEALNTRHVAVAVGATLLMLLVAAAHQWSVGNIGPKSDSLVCAEHCQSKGFAGSGMPPRDSGDRTCSCFDAQGREFVNPR